MAETPDVTNELDQILRTRLRIFVDANVLISMLSGEQNRGVDRLHVISKASKASLLTSDITRIEVAKNLAEFDCKKIAPMTNPKFRQLANEMLNVRLPAIEMCELYQKAFERHRTCVEDLTDEDLTDLMGIGYWECMKAEEIDLLDIFLQYGKKHGLFSEHTKKHQFADAIVFEQLRCRATDDIPIIIFSRDRDFAKICSETENIDHVDSWDGLLKLLQIDEDVPEVDGLIDGYKDKIVKIVSDRFDDHNTNEFKTDTLTYITGVETKPSVSMRFENEIVVSGGLVVRAQLPSGCSHSYIQLWESIGSLWDTDIRDGVDVYCEVNVLAHLYDGLIGMADSGEKRELYGTLELEIVGYTYHFMQAEWPVSES